MAPVAVPEILNQIALAGAAGARIAPSREVNHDLDLCRRWGHNIDLEGDLLSLRPNADALVPKWIENETPAIAWPKLEVTGFFELGSTNEEALARLRKRNAVEGLLIFAEHQTAGKGRQGRSWHACRGQGLYFSFVVQPLRPQRHWVVLTHAASAAMARSVRDLFREFFLEKPLAVDLKWPNDVLVSGRKAAGILLECLPGKSGESAAVIGVGVNVGRECVPPSLEHTATALNHEAGLAVPRRWLLVRFLLHFQLLYGLFQDGNSHAVLEAWKSCSSMWKDTAVSIVDSEGERHGVTCGLTENGALRVRGAEGREEIVLAADVSIRMGSASKET